MSNISSSTSPAKIERVSLLTQYQTFCEGWYNVKCWPNVKCSNANTMSNDQSRATKTMLDIVAGQCVTVWQGDNAIYDIGAWLHKRITQMESLGSGCFYSQYPNRRIRAFSGWYWLGMELALIKTWNVECMHSIYIGSRFRSDSWKWQSVEYPLPSDSWSDTWHWLAGWLRIWEEIFLSVY